MDDAEKAWANDVICALSVARNWLTFLLLAVAVDVWIGACHASQANARIAALEQAQEETE